MNRHRRPEHRTSPLVWVLLVVIVIATIIFLIITVDGYEADCQTKYDKSSCEEFFQ